MERIGGLVMDNIKEILIGIDKTESDCVTGWWETSKGAEFGSVVKKNLLELSTCRQKFMEI